MKDFREAIAACGQPADESEAERLLAVWQRAFLNYSPSAPDQWSDSEGEFSGDFSRPGLAVPFLRLLCSVPGGVVKFRDTIQGYVEFAAAVWREAFTSQECSVLRDFLTEKEGDMPDVAPYTQKLMAALARPVLSGTAVCSCTLCNPAHPHQVYPL